jgi:tRNA (guanosine-2'-O-)-methyltransferase
MSESKIRAKNPKDIRRERPTRGHGCWDHLIAAPLWPMHGLNLGTLLRTCDAVGACMTVPKYPWVPEAIERSYTFPHKGCVHWSGNQLGWLQRQAEAPGTSIVGVELADEAVRLADLPPAKGRTVMILGHEQTGIPPEAVSFLDMAVEIPMAGAGTSLNVAVAGSLVLYKLAGLL